MTQWNRLKKYHRVADFANIDVDAGDFIHTKKQMQMSKEIIEDIAWAEEPHTLAERLGFPVTTVKSFLKKLRDEDIVETKTVTEDGREYIAVDPETNAYLLMPSTNWEKFKKEYERLKRQGRFK
jgi:DNA-binding MarR family transcriptional regulator